MRICLIASPRFPIREPFAGGLEAHTHGLSLELRARGHDVTLFAAPGSDPELRAEELPVQVFAPSDAARSDVGATPDWWIAEHHAYLALMLRLREGAHDFDLVHNNSLHHLPIAMASLTGVPMVTTLHTPPLGWLESALRFAGPECHFITVSAAMQRAWRHVVASRVVHNGVDTHLWREGPGGGRGFWFGRLVPEKAPHEAVEAARRAGLPLDLVGPKLDPHYFETQVQPLLSAHVRYLGHLPQRSVRHLVGSARVLLLTPSWDEPFGLVAAESMSTGTPIAGYARGALPEIVTACTGSLAAAGDIDGLARAVALAGDLDRATVAREARSRFGVVAMVDAYEELYHQACGPRAAA